MARKRTIDPDSWTDEKLADLSIGAHLLWVGLVSLADDEGRIEWNARQFKARLFAMKQEASLVTISRWMDENIEHVSVITYEAGGRTFAYHPAWSKHQYINKKTPSKLPAPPITGPSIDAVGGSGTDADEQNPSSPYRSSTVLLPEYSLTRIGEVLESPVPLVSVSGTVLESEEPAGAGEPRSGHPCICEVLKLARGEYQPDDLVELFLAVFANRRSKKTRRSSLALWTGWLREMRGRYLWSQIWAAFAQAHRDGEHSPLHGSSAVWSNLRATSGIGAAPGRPGLKIVSASDFGDAV